METINKLLKKQAPKTNRRNALHGDETPDADGNRVGPLYVRWVSSKEGTRLAVPQQMLVAPAGQLFIGPGASAGGKMVQEVS